MNWLPGCTVIGVYFRAILGFLDYCVPWTFASQQSIGPNGLTFRFSGGSRSVPSAAAVIPSTQTRPFCSAPRALKARNAITPQDTRRSKIYYAYGLSGLRAHSSMRLPTLRNPDSFHSSAFQAFSERHSAGSAREGHVGERDEFDQRPLYAVEQSREHCDGNNANSSKEESDEYGAETSDCQGE